MSRSTALNVTTTWHMLATTWHFVTHS